MFIGAFADVTIVPVKARGLVKVDHFCIC
jgi:hypothetical protein